MALHQRFEEDMKSALKTGDKDKLSALRMVVSDIKTHCIEKNLKELSDADTLRIVQKHIKQHRESIDQFTKGNRLDLVGKEAGELKMLELYMPKQLTAEELTVIVGDTVKSLGAVSKADMGKVMKAVTEKTAGRADGKAINQIVLQFLK